jgi:hypothetical protein
MIPMEVADIANMIMAKYECEAFSSEEEREYAIELAWDIYNYCQKMLKA